VPIDTTEQTFERDVIQRSYEQPVVVDFWAEWCGPCRSLGPVIEQAVAKRDGQVSLVKVDTDANPRLSQAFGIQSIPAVKAFKDGKVVDEFIGALPPVQVERFLDGIVPSEADALVAEGGETNLRRALELEPGRTDATLALATLLHARGQTEEALELVDPLEHDFAAQGLAARIRLEQHDELETRDAFAALDEGDRQRALDLLLDAISSAESDGKQDDLRKVIVGILDLLGVDHPLAREYRRRLATSLY
jgi:putative thioredoxin